MAQTLDSDLTSAADDAFYSKHPEMVRNGQRVPIGAPGYDDPTLKEEWAKDYKREQAGQNPPATVKGRVTKQAVGDPVAPCSTPNCGIKDFTLTCQHEGKDHGPRRVHSTDGRLQIVASSGAEHYHHQFGIDKVIKLTVEGIRGGVDSVVARVFLAADSGGTCQPQIEITPPVPAAPVMHLTDGYETGFQSPRLSDDDSYWLEDFEPEVYQIRGWGNPNEPEMAIQVEVFPSDGITKGKIELDGISSKMSDTCAQVCAWFDRFTGGVATVSFRPSTPVGFVQLACGWKESKDWRAFWGFELIFGLDPLLGLKGEVAVDVAKLAGMCVDLPPYLMDDLLKFDMGVAVEGSLGVSGRWAQTDADATQKDVRGTGKITVEVKVKPKVGGPVACAALEVSAKTGISVAIDVGIQQGPKGGLFWAAQFSMEALELKMTLTFAAFKTVPAKVDLVDIMPWQKFPIGDRFGPYILLHKK